MRQYTSADGLAQDHVQQLAFDRDGFLWIATDGGLSQFDGERFVNYGERDGLRGRIVEDISIGADGTYWVATDGGVFTFRPGEKAPVSGLFTQVPLPPVSGNNTPHRVLATRSGIVWVGTMARLFRLERGPDGRYQARPFELMAGSPPKPMYSRVQTLAESPDGAVWVGSHLFGIFRIGLDGRVDHCPQTVRGADFIRDFYFPADGSVWTTFVGGVAIFEHSPFATPRLPARTFMVNEGMPFDTAELLPTHDGRMLVSSSQGITEMRRSESGAWTVGPTLDRRSGLPGDWVISLKSDTEGNVWAGLGSRGIVKLLENGFSIVDEENGAGTGIVDLAVDRAGRLVSLAARGARSLAVVLPGEGSRIYRPHLSESMTYVGWGGNQKLLIDSRGAWWIASGDGVLRWDDPGEGDPRGLERPPDRVFGLRDGIPGDDAFVLFEDSRGDVWMSVQPKRPGGSGLSRWSRASGRIESFPVDELRTYQMAGQFLEARDGSLWMYFLNGSLQRYRGGQFERVAGWPRADDFRGLFEDSRGRLWALGQPSLVCENPSAKDPQFSTYALDVGGVDTRTVCAIEDNERRIWFGTTHGVLRLDPDSGRTRRFTVEDGLSGNPIELCERDGSGQLWFSDVNGLTRVDPRTDVSRALSPARIREVRIAGETIPLPPTGATSAGTLTVPAQRPRIAVDFFSVHVGAGRTPRFQYRLLGAEKDWSPPVDDRSVQYAHLTSGRYDFEVRSVGEDGTPSEATAKVSFQVLAPVWRRGWFLALCALGIAAIGYALYRARIARAIALERIRTRIATDLHDDVGSSLTQISILSQLANRDAATTGGVARESLERMTALSGEVIDSMSDVVWAIGPRWDTVSALVHRMRRFASDLFADQEVALDLSLPEADNVPIDPDVRRQLYLVFKEALHNVRRHSGARRVGVALQRRGGGWRLRIEEDGKGFDPLREAEGHGLRSMRRRAERIGGRLDVRSSQEGTTLTLDLPHGPEGSRWARFFRAGSYRHE